MYKRTGGNTTTLHNHLKGKHLDKLDDGTYSETEINRNRGTIGTMDRFVVNAIPVSFGFFYIIFIYLRFYY